MLDIKGMIVTPWNKYRREWKFPSVSLGSPSVTFNEKKRNS